MPRYFNLALLANLLFALSAFGQDAEFQKKYGEWKALVAQLREIQGQYIAAEGEKAEALEKQFAETVSKAEAMVPDVTRAGLAALKANPKDEKTSDFVEQLAMISYQRDDLDVALEAAKLLVENQDKGGKKYPRMYAVGGVAAFEMHQFDLAEEYLKQAAKDDAGELVGELARDVKDRQDRLKEEREFWKKEEEIRKQEDKPDGDPKALPRVLFKTTKGDVTLELFENEAPDTVGNFISLVEDGFYNGLTFHRVLPGFMAQGGDPDGNGSGGPGYKIPCECYGDNYRRHFRGSLSMAHSGRDSGGSQFFLTFRGTRHLDRDKAAADAPPRAGHTVFGRVIKGTQVLSEMRRNPGRRGAPADKITEATVLRKRKHEYKPNKVGDDAGKKEEKKKPKDEKKKEKKKKEKTKKE